ncbi:purine-cytosine permease family protein [Burkholderia multivorans]|uniref:purine-cytosine permease family protein n=1 Tax=Burkholderia multivorans TaxID=87883 RepID=UPI0028580383|nr:cytosine permease [Burkholderia multivorans]MDR8970589.1 hypothetical protein [Burkholderia multivorans]
MVHPAIVLGNAVGGFFTSLHSAQGPKLGVPQMIQSRAQFGYYGAILPLVLALMIYVGFYATGLVLGGQAMSALFHIPPQAGAVVFALMSTALAIVGYRYIHRFSRVAAVLSGVAFAILLVRIIADGNMPIPIATHGFAAAPFALGISISASWQLTFGPYIADYSRYLPAETSTRATIGWTFLGSVLGGSVAMILGALAAALGGAAFSNDQVGYLAALGGAIWPLVLLAVICGKLTGNTLSSYGGCMSLTTIVTSLTGQDRVSPRQRAAFVCIISAIALGIALAASRNFLSNFTNFLLFLLYFMTPWSAINLVDYYWVRRERYKVAQFFRQGRRVRACQDRRLCRVLLWRIDPDSVHEQFALRRPHRPSARRRRNRLGDRARRRRRSLLRLHRLHPKGDGRDVCEPRHLIDFQIPITIRNRYEVRSVPRKKPSPVFAVQELHSTSVPSAGSPVAVLTASTTWRHTASGKI